MIYSYTFFPGKCTKDPVCNEMTTTTNRKNSKILKFGKILLDLEKTIQDMSIAYPEQEDNFGLDNNDYWIKKKQLEAKKPWNWFFSIFHKKCRNKSISWSFFVSFFH